MLNMVVFPVAVFFNPSRPMFDIGADRPEDDLPIQTVVGGPIFSLFDPLEYYLVIFWLQVTAFVIRQDQVYGLDPLVLVHGVSHFQVVLKVTYQETKYG